MKSSLGTTIVPVRTSGRDNYFIRSHLLNFVNITCSITTQLSISRTQCRHKLSISVEEIRWSYLTVQLFIQLCTRLAYNSRYKEEHPDPYQISCFFHFNSFF